MLFSSLVPLPQVLDREGQMDNPCTTWLADAYWDNITELDKLTNFHGLMNSFEQYPRDWNLWYTNATPEKAMLPGAWSQASLSFLFLPSASHLLFPLIPPLSLPSSLSASAPWPSVPAGVSLFRLPAPPGSLTLTLTLSPGEWENACNEMQRMLIVRSLRQDRVAFCVTSFIVSNLGSRFIEPPVLNMKLVSGSFAFPPASRCPSLPPALPQSLPRPHLAFCLRSHPVLLAGDGGLGPTDPTGVHPVPRRGPHQCLAPAG